MVVGIVKWYNPDKGYGFIAPEDGSQDAFIHVSELERAGLQVLREGDRIEYEAVEGQKGMQAVDLKELG